MAAEEAAFRKQVLDVARKTGWKVYGAEPQRHQLRGGIGVKGYPDLTLFRRGRLVVLELKREKGGVVSVEQAAWIAEWERVAVNSPFSVRVAVVKPSDLEMVATWLA